MPVGGARKFLFDNVPDQKKLAAAEQRTDDEGGQRRNKHHGDAADDPRYGERQDNADKSIDIAGTEVVGGIDYVFIDLRQRIIQGQHHKRQEIIYHAEHDGIRRIYDPDVRQVQESEQMIDHPAFFQKGLPCQRAEQKIHPHGQDKNQDNKTVLVRLHMRQNHCQRISEQETDQRAAQREQEGKAQRLSVAGSGNCYDVVECECAGGIGQSVVEDHTQRYDNESDGPERVRRGQPFVFRCQLLLPPHLQIPVCS